MKWDKYKCKKCWIEVIYNWIWFPPIIHTPEVKEKWEVIHCWEFVLINTKNQ